jgi:ankyrin repeat protein
LMAAQALLERIPGETKMKMGEFMTGDGGGPLMARDNVAQELAVRSNMTTGSSMLSDDEVLALAHGSSVGILRFGIGSVLGAEARVISSELQNAAKSGRSKSLNAYEVCRKALELYLRDSGLGKLSYVVNSRLRRVRSIRSPDRAEFARAVTESCGDLADFVRLVWEGLNFEFSETPRGREVVIYRGVELPEAALESYRNSVGKLISWSMFSSFTEKRDEAEEYGMAWRGGVQVMFELRSALCPRLQNGTYLLHPFAVLRVEVVLGNVVELVEIGLPEPGTAGPLPRQLPGVSRERVRITGLHVAAELGDVRAIARFATHPELINARDPDGWTPLHVAANHGKCEAVKALTSLGADVNVRHESGATPVFMATQQGHLEVVRTLASLGADLNVGKSNGVTPVCIAVQQGHLEIVKALVSLGADVKIRLSDGATPVHFAAEKGHVEMIKALASVGADVNAPLKDGATPLHIAAQEGHLEAVNALALVGGNVNVARCDGAALVLIAALQGELEIVLALASLSADVNVRAKGGATAVFMAAQMGHLEVVRALASLGADVNARIEKGATPLSIAARKGHVNVVKALVALGAEE